MINCIHCLHSCCNLFVLPEYLSIGNYDVVIHAFDSFNALMFHLTAFLPGSEKNFLEFIEQFKRELCLLEILLLNKPEILIICCDLYTISEILFILREMSRVLLKEFVSQNLSLSIFLLLLSVVLTILLARFLQVFSQLHNSFLNQSLQVLCHLSDGICLRDIELFDRGDES